MADAKTATTTRAGIDTGDKQGEDGYEVHVRQRSPPASRSRPPPLSLALAPTDPSSSTIATSSPATRTTTTPTSLGAAVKPRAPSKRSSTTSLSGNSSPRRLKAAMSTTTLKEGVTPTQRISRAKKGKRVHACNYPECQKVFTRAEHLRRHQLNHSTEVHYTCPMCDKKFVRQDLLSRHTDRHASQARKAVQTLALAQRHQQFSSHFGINRMVLAAPPPPLADYGGNAHVFETTANSVSRVHSVDTSAVPHLVSGHHSHTSSPTTPHSTASLPAYSPGFPTPMSIPHAADSPLDFASADSTPSPSASLRRAHLPFHLQHSEPQRQPDPYMVPVTSHPEGPRPLTLTMDHPHMYAKTVPSWDNYAWLFDDSISEQVPMDMHQTALSYVLSLETSHYQSAGLSTDQGSLDGSKGTPLPVFHTINERKGAEVQMLLNNFPGIHASNCATISSMNFYLGLYWTKFHIRYPILHRPTFLPGSEDVMLVAIVLAIGASFADDAAHQFAMALYERIRGLILNTDELANRSISDLGTQQTILLADIFGKMRSKSGSLEGSHLSTLLNTLLRRTDLPSGDPTIRIKRMMRDNIEIDYQAEWQAWMTFESRKRVCLFFFLWDVQQAVLFGRDMCQTAFDVRVNLPCEEFLWNSDTPADWAGYITGQPEYPELMATVKMFLDPRRPLPALTPLSAVFVLMGLISVGFDLYRRSSPVVENPEDTVKKQAKLVRGFETWRRHFESIMAQSVVQHWYHKMMLLYHVTFISLHTNLRSLLSVSSDYRFLRRNSNTSTDMYQAKRELQQWAATPQAPLATWHACRALMLGLDRAQLHEELLYPWAMYISALCCWAYGHFTAPALGSGALSNDGDGIWDPHDDVRVYLQQMNTESWESLVHVGVPRKRTSGLLSVVQGTIEGGRLGLIQESVEVLKRLTISRSVK